MIKVIGFPYDRNSSFLRGSALAPPRIRLMDFDGSANQFCENGFEIADGKAYEDLGDLPIANLKPEEAFRVIKEKMTELLMGPNKVLSLGGDHSITFPIMEAYTEKYNNLHLIHFDAHADLYEDFDNNYFSHASPFTRILEQGKIKSLTQVGIRTLHPLQREQAEKYGVEIIEMKGFDLDFVKKLKGPLYISLDLDVLDPAFAPGVSHHEPGGFSSREFIEIIQNITVPVVGADIVEYNPIRDVNNMTAMVAYKILKEFIAKMMD